MILYDHSFLLLSLWNKDIFIQFTDAKLQGKPLQEPRVKLLDFLLNSAHVYWEKGKRKGVSLW